MKYDLQISTLSSRLKATVSVAGVDCTYRASLSDTYSGMLQMPRLEAAVPLELWVEARGQNVRLPAGDWRRAGARLDRRQRRALDDGRRRPRCPATASNAAVAGLKA